MTKVDDVLSVHRVDNPVPPVVIAQIYVRSEYLQRDESSVTEGLPLLLYWPNLEVVIVIFYAAGVTESCTAVMGSVTAIHFKGTLALAVLG